ncbi:MAG: Rne/Rng family ribonuclease [Phycisphaeraceae bacterium]|nr:Rne/Rng family ribonuclease [Phycisphaeraceae bacterium]
MAETKDKIKRQLIINYVPGEECRVAVVNNGRLDEFFSEKRDSVSHVGNIYVGRVTNVEPSIQAAFIDFGLPQGGFLHVSDVHPYYFPSDDSEEGATERVGKKTPRRDRPPIQDCFKRGQEIVVQVLKEGVGSKGPTVTSYLSIPGRYLVMMPQMDRVGVSRKVEDEELRKKMVAILDQLDLPDGFGFILRTAGLDRTKTELKRDLAYLMRLQKDMEKRRKAGSKTRLLYAESDLLLRALRDMLTADTDEVIIDSEPGLKRAANFMRIFSPRSSTKLLHFSGNTPIYHALGVEEQIRTMYSRDVPLPSGGRLVIDEAEALVAIDVNSGKSRSAGDSEENAYNTNLEAADEICRQLRLRDLGGIVINDLIDMRSAKHRRDIEARFQAILETDRARSTVLPIGEFGVLELTRQRMRGSHESIHFQDCPTCRGRGMIQRPDSVAADALRELAALLDHPKVAKAEMVINPRIAGELLSSKRKHLSRLERITGKQLAIRLSDATGLDRVAFYAYDAQGSDIEIDRLPKRHATSRARRSKTPPSPKSSRWNWTRTHPPPRVKTFLSQGSTAGAAKRNAAGAAAPRAAPRPAEMRASAPTAHASTPHHGANPSTHRASNPHTHTKAPTARPSPATSRAAPHQAKVQTSPAAQPAIVARPADAADAADGAGAAAAAMPAPTGNPPPPLAKEPQQPSSAPMMRSNDSHHHPQQRTSPRVAP